MKNKIAYKFISYPYNCEYGSSVNCMTEYSIMDRDINIDDMFEQFQHFLACVGYQIPKGARLDFVYDDDGEV